MKLVDLPEKRLPPDFADRLVRDVRRRRRIHRLRVVAAVLVTTGILVAGMVGGVCCRERGRSLTGARLVAADPPLTDGTNVTSLLMLGFFKDCFRRNRTEKKEED